MVHIDTMRREKETRNRVALWHSVGCDALCWPATYTGSMEYLGIFCDTSGTRQGRYHLNAHPELKSARRRTQWQSKRWKDEKRLRSNAKALAGLGLNQG